MKRTASKATLHWCNAELAGRLLQQNPHMETLELDVGADYFNKTDGSVFARYLSHANVQHILFRLPYTSDRMPRAVLEPLIRAVGNNPIVTKVTIDGKQTTRRTLVPYGLDEILRTSTSVCNLSVDQLDFGNDIDNDALVQAFATNTLLTKLELGKISSPTLACRLLDVLHTHASLKELVVGNENHPSCRQEFLHALNRLILATRTLSVLRIEVATFMDQALFPELQPGTQTTLEELHFTSCKFWGSSVKHLKRFVHHSVTMRRLVVNDLYYTKNGASVASILLAPARSNSMPIDVIYNAGGYLNGAENITSLFDVLASSDPRTDCPNKLVLSLAPRNEIDATLQQQLQEVCRRLPEIGNLQHLSLNVPLSTPLLQALENNFSLVTLETVDDASVTAKQQMKRKAYLDRNRQLSTLMLTLPANACIRPTLRVAAMPTGRLAYNDTLRGLLKLGDLK